MPINWDRIFDFENRERRVELIPTVTPIQLETLVQLTHAVWDGYVISKQARDDLVELELATRWNGWQIITQKGLCVLETLGMLPTKYTSRDF